VLERPASSRMGPSRYGGDSDESRVAAAKDGSDYVDVDKILRQLKNFSKTSGQMPREESLPNLNDCTIGTSNAR